MKKRLLKFISINICILICIYLLFKFHIINGCVFHNMFSIPCPGCGVTRSFLFLIKGDIVTSIKYSILTIPLIIVYIVYLIIGIKDIIKNENKLKEIFLKYQAYIFIIILILVIISEVKNIFNPLLY